MHIFKEPILNPRTQGLNELIFFLHFLDSEAHCNVMHGVFCCFLDVILDFVVLQKPVDEPHVLAIIDGWGQHLGKDGL